MSGFNSFWSKFNTADYVAVPVNCVGIMGAGLAKAIFPHLTKEDFLEYIKFCKVSAPGDSKLGSSKYVFCFTKRHWKDSSQVSWVEDCIKNLIPLANAEKTLLLPRLGAGLGGIKPTIVDALFEKYLPEMKWKAVYLT